MNICEGLIAWLDTFTLTEVYQRPRLHARIYPNVSRATPSNQSTVNLSYRVINRLMTGVISCSDAPLDESWVNSFSHQ